MTQQKLLLWAAVLAVTFVGVLVGARELRSTLEEARPTWGLPSPASSSWDGLPVHPWAPPPPGAPGLTGSAPENTAGLMPQPQDLVEQAPALVMTPDEPPVVPRGGTPATPGEPAPPRLVPGSATALMPPPTPGAQTQPPVRTTGSGIGTSGSTDVTLQGVVPAAPTDPMPSTADRSGVAASTADAYGPPPAPHVDPRRFSEAHWQGLEVIPKTPRLAQALGIPVDLPGVLVDDATLPADLQGFQAGDVILSIERIPTGDLVAFIRASERVRDQGQAELELWRNGQRQVLPLTALLTHLGTANGETPPMILPGALPPHRYRGPCNGCHRIGSNGQLAIDQGDVTPAPPPINANAVRPHLDFGPCTTCHQLLP